MRATPGAEVSRPRSRMATSWSERSEDTTQVPGHLFPWQTVLEKREVESEKSDRPFYLERMGSTSEHCFKRLHSFGLNPLFFPLCPMDGDLGTNLD